MNKPYHQTDEERDQSRKLEQEQAQEQKSRQQDGRITGQDRKDKKTREPGIERRDE